MIVIMIPHPAITWSGIPATYESGQHDRSGTPPEDAGGHRPPCCLPRCTTHLTSVECCIDHKTARRGDCEDDVQLTCTRRRRRAVIIVGAGAAAAVVESSSTSIIESCKESNLQGTTGVASSERHSDPQSSGCEHHYGLASSLGQRSSVSRGWVIVGGAVRGSERAREVLAGSDVEVCDSDLFRCGDLCF